MPHHSKLNDLHVTIYWWRIFFQPAWSWFLEIVFVRRVGMRVCAHVHAACMCVYVRPQATKNSRK